MVRNSSKRTSQKTGNSPKSFLTDLLLNSASEIGPLGGPGLCKGPAAQRVPREFIGALYRGTSGESF